MHRFTCPVCQSRHDDLPIYAFKGPVNWHSASEEERARDWDLGSELAVLRDEMFAIRGRLQVPISDMPGDVLEFGVWAVVSRDNYATYRDTHLNPGPTLQGVFYGWLANQIPGFDTDTVNLRVQVQPQGHALRPFFALVTGEVEHPLIQWQQDGITLDEAMRWLHQHGGF